MPVKSCKKICKPTKEGVVSSAPIWVDVCGGNDSAAEEVRSKEYPVSYIRAKPFPTLHLRYKIGLHIYMLEASQKHTLVDPSAL